MEQLLGGWLLVDTRETAMQLLHQKRSSPLMRVGKMRVQNQKYQTRIVENQRDQRQRQEPPRLKKLRSSGSERCAVSTLVPKQTLSGCRRRRRSCRFSKPTWMTNGWAWQTRVWRPVSRSTLTVVASLRRLHKWIMGLGMRPTWGVGRVSRQI